MCGACIALVELPLRELARELTVAIDGVLGTNSDEPGFEAKWDVAEVTCDRAREALGMKKGGAA